MNELKLEEDKKELKEYESQLRIRQNKNRDAFIRWVTDNPTHSRELPWLVFIDERLIRAGVTFEKAIQGLDQILFCHHIDDIKLFTNPNLQC